MSRDTISAQLERLRLRLWFIPALFAIAAGLGAVALLAVDRALSGDGPSAITFGGTAEGARSVLSTVAQSMLTFTGLVFTITMLVLQLAANSLSPRVMRTFIRDRKNQVVLGLFVATFVFTLVVLREVRTPNGDDGFVPGLSTWAAFVLLLASVAAFVYYIDHMAHAIRASTVISNIADETRDAIDDRYPEVVPDDRGDAPALGPPLDTVGARAGGTLVAIDEEALVQVAVEHDLLVEVVPSVGDFVPTGGSLFRLYSFGGRRPDQPRVDAIRDDLMRAAQFGNERTLHQDASFGIRQLVDVAARALSPGTNDPTTAVQAIDQIHDLLRIVAGRPRPRSVRLDDERHPRVLRAERSWEELVALGFDELRLYGAAHLLVARRLGAALSDLIAVAPPDRTAILVAQRDRLDDAITHALTDPRDRRTATNHEAPPDGKPNT